MERLCLGNYLHLRQISYLCCTIRQHYKALGHFQ
nr:MAG TPA: hypothetical protein [Caudoviricetes sp.]